MDISIVIPVYEAAASIEKVIDELEKSTFLHSQKWELILVDDQSKDDSFHLIEKKAREYPNILGLKLHKNVGQHSATLAGIREAKGALLITMDDDGEHPVEQLPKLVATLEETQADLVFGVPEASKKNFFRERLSKTYKRTARWFSEGYGEGSAFRLMRREIYTQLQRHSGPFIFIDEVLAWYTKSVVFLPMHFLPSGKKSTYRSRQLFRLFSNIMFTYSSFPAQFLTKLGLASSFISFLLGMFFIVRKLFFKAQLGFTSIAVSILFSASIILLGLGIIAQYIYRQNRLLHQFPQYSIKQRTR
jgi:undecaprenyl-phosphate 4-deoxy-4-formamido-L-arabinose transferase